MGRSTLRQITADLYYPLVERIPSHSHCSSFAPWLSFYQLVATCGTEVIRLRRVILRYILKTGALELGPSGSSLCLKTADRAIVLWFNPNSHGKLVASNPRRSQVIYSIAPTSDESSHLPVGNASNANIRFQSSFMLTTIQPFCFIFMGGTIACISRAAVDVWEAHLQAAAV